MNKEYNMRRLMSLMEGREIGNPDVEYNTTGKTKTGAIDRVTAKVSGNISGKFTRLMQKLQRIEVLSEELERTKEEVKQSSKEDVAALFDVEDAVLTRVIETKSVILTMSKDPTRGNTVAYANILKELETHLTPELMAVLAKLTVENTKLGAEKSPTLKYNVRELDEDTDEDTTDFGSVVEKVERWLPKFDAKLEEIKRSI